MEALVVVKRNSIVCYFSDRDTPVSTAVPTSAMADMEIVNETELTAVIDTLLGAKPVHPTIPTILVLSDELCFSEKAPLRGEEQTKAKLTNSVPLVRVATTLIRLGETTVVVAANADLYDTIAHILAEKGYPVTLVIPWSAIVQAGMSTHGELDKVTVRRVFEAQSSLKSMSFPCENTQTTEVSVAAPEKQSSTKRLPIGWFIFGGFALLYAVGMVWYMMRRG